MALNECFRSAGTTSILMMALSALLACAASSTAAAREPASVAKAVAARCPASGFNEFLRAFAHPEGDDVRRRFTRDPLEYEVPTHAVRDDAEGLAPTHVALERGNARLKRFSYRYMKDFGLYVPVSVSTNEVSLQAMREGAFNAPTAIERSGSDAYRVDFGMEYEIDTYLFKRSDGCWVLTRAINLRD